MTLADTMRGWFRQPSQLDALRLEAEYRAAETDELRAGLEATRRELERQALLGFDAAEKDNGRWDWTTQRTGPNGVISSAGDSLVARSRDLYRNNPLARRACTSLANNLVGDGIRPMVEGLPSSVERTVVEHWERFVAECHTGSAATFYTLQSQAALALFQDGDALLRRRPRRMSDGLAVPLQLQPLEIDMLDTTKDGTGSTSEGGVIIHGIEFDPLDRRVGYHLHRYHPRETAGFYAGQPLGARSSLIPSADVAHLFDVSRARAGQVKGIPWLHAVMNSLRDLEDYNVAEIVRKKGEACFVAAVTVDEPQNDHNGLQAKDGGAIFVDADGQPIDRITPGMMFAARGGKTIEFNRPGPSVGVAEYERTRQRSISAGALIPYALLTNDLSDVNYSSIRAGLNEFRGMITAMRSQVFIPLWCDPPWRWFIASMISAGIVRPRPRRKGSPPDPYFGFKPTWSAPPFQSVDRLKDAEADVLEIRAGLSSLPEILHNRGKSLDNVLAALASFYELADGKGLILDSDARNAWRKGVKGAELVPKAGATNSTGDGAG